MKYIDRKGNVTVEENEQDKFLRHLYNDRGGRLCLRVLVQPFVSKMAGVFLNTGLSARFVPGFVEKNRIDLGVYEKQKFSSWNDFFTRRIREGERPIDERKNILVSPCDGKLSVYRIGEGSRFFIKDTEYTVEQLLRNKKLADRYLGGYAMVFRLTVDDYHHYCYVADGEKSVNVTLPGVYHTVNPAANEVFPIYRENAREYTLLKTKEFGTILMMEVGAMMVGKITNLWRGTCGVKKGQEKGRFEFGGSTIILLLQHGKVRLDHDLLENTEEGYETIVKMGERIGETRKRQHGAVSADVSQ
ncbi:phosphatidylserine decarboxylase [Blautia luti]|uniref:phosphatidylserine decarboxylase n=1 Tax=Blautia luti TaxID=89014 RepID=UPI0018AC63A7|nr:phosphatidylserine decarboxylase [Blautia luti]